MRVPLSWLSDFVDLPDSVEALAEQLTMTGLEVDAIEHSGPDLSEIVVGHVLGREQHPDADRLSVCRVDIGAADGEPQTIVCGAPNVDAGQRVAVAVPGVKLQGKKLKKSKIRGVVSNGMICSESELELSGEHEGILVLDTDVAPGTPLDRVLRAGETVLEIAITANRGDCASLLGIAREVRAAFGGELRIPPCEPAEAGAPAGDAIRVDIEDPQGCFAYAARVVRGVQVGPSPEWLQARLEAADLRPINVAVDVTNLVLLELGQPLHAFDLALVREGHVRVRRAEQGETIIALDDREHELCRDDLVIADAERPIAIAGVIGGANSEVSDATSDILLEAAHFDAGRVRATARRHGVFTDASYRFERGIDRDGVVRAIDRAARLIAELAGGEVAPGVVLARGAAPDVVERIALDPARVNRMLGTSLDAAAVRELLGRLGIATSPSDGALDCSVPSHRTDLRIEADLVEEVARMHGYNAIAPVALEGQLVSGHKPAPLVLADRVRDALTAEGLTEVQTFPFLDPTSLTALGLGESDPRRETLRVVNPLVESDAALRSTQVPALLRLVRENRSRQVDAVSLFEVSRVFRVEKAGELPEERLRASAVITRGDDAGLWQRGEGIPLFYEAKGAAERLAAALDRELTFAVPQTPEPYLHPGASADLLAGKQRVGVVGELHPAVATRLEIDCPCALIEVDLSSVGDLPTRERQYHEVSKHPQVRRDLAILLDRDQSAAEVVAAVQQKGGVSLVAVEVFDRYEGAGVPEGKVSVALRLVFQRGDRTLTDDEVAKAVNGVLKMLAHRFSAEQR
jgi:phenylalanyl-tRNA synthetase beta chain